MGWNQREGQRKQGKSGDKELMLAHEVWTLSCPKDLSRDAFAIRWEYALAILGNANEERTFSYLSTILLLDLKF